MAANRRIRLRSTYATSDEARASASIKPGMCLQIGTDGRVAPKATAGGAMPCMIAEEDGKREDGTVDMTYLTGELVKYFYPLPGDHVNVLLATGQNATISSILINNTSGTYNVAAAETTQRDFQAREALNNASGSAQLLRAVKL